MASTEIVAIMTHRDAHGASSYFIGTFTSVKVAWAAIIACEILNFGFRDWHKLGTRHSFPYATHDVIAWAVHDDTLKDAVRTVALAIIDYRNAVFKDEFSYYEIFERTAGAWDGQAVLSNVLTRLDDVVQGNDERE